MKDIKHLILPVIATIITIIGSALSAARVNELLHQDLLSQDKFMHFACYFVVTVLWANGLDKCRRVKPVVSALILSTILGTTLEVCQYLFFEGRAFDFLDIIANISGSLIGALVFIKFIK